MLNIQYKIDKYIKNANFEFSENKNVVNALVDYHRALDLFEFLERFYKPQKHEILVRIAISYDILGNFMKTLDFLNLAMDIIPNVSCLVLYKSVILQTLGKYSESQKTLIKFKQIAEKNDIQLYETFKLVFLFTMNLEKDVMLREIDEYLDKYNKIPLILYLKAMVYYDIYSETRNKNESGEFTNNSENCSGYSDEENNHPENSSSENDENEDEKTNEYNKKIYNGNSNNNANNNDFLHISNLNEFDNNLNENNDNNDKNDKTTKNNNNNKNKSTLDKEKKAFHLYEQILKEANELDTIDTNFLIKEGVNQNNLTKIYFMTLPEMDFYQPRPLVEYSSLNRGFALFFTLFRVREAFKFLIRKNNLFRKYFTVNIANLVDNNSNIINNKNSGLNNFIDDKNNSNNVNSQGRLSINNKNNINVENNKEQKNDLLGTTGVIGIRGTNGKNNNGLDFNTNIHNNQLNIQNTNQINNNSSSKVQTNNKKIFLIELNINKLKFLSTTDKNSNKLNKISKEFNKELIWLTKSIFITNLPVIKKLKKKNFNDFYVLISNNKIPNSITMTSSISNENTNCNNVNIPTEKDNNKYSFLNILNIPEIKLLFNSFNINLFFKNSDIKEENDFDKNNNLTNKSKNTSDNLKLNVNLKENDIISKNTSPINIFNKKNILLFFIDFVIYNDTTEVISFLSSIKNKNPNDTNTNNSKRVKDNRKLSEVQEEEFLNKFTNAFIVNTLKKSMYFIYVNYHYCNKLQTLNDVSKFNTNIKISLNNNNNLNSNSNSNYSTVKGLNTIKTNSNLMIFNKNKNFNTAENAYNYQNPILNSSKLMLLPEENIKNDYFNESILNNIDMNYFIRKKYYCKFNMKHLSTLVNNNISEQQKERQKEKEFAETSKCPNCRKNYYQNNSKNQLISNLPPDRISSNRKFSEKLNLADNNNYSHNIDEISISLSSVYEFNLNNMKNNHHDQKNENFSNSIKKLNNNKIDHQTNESILKNQFKEITEKEMKKLSKNPQDMKIKNSNFNNSLDNLLNTSKSINQNNYGNVDPSSTKQYTTSKNNNYKTSTITENLEMDKIIIKDKENVKIKNNNNNNNNNIKSPINENIQEIANLNKNNYIDKINNPSQKRNNPNFLNNLNNLPSNISNSNSTFNHLNTKITINKNIMNNKEGLNINYDKNNEKNNSKKQTHNTETTYNSNKQYQNNQNKKSNYVSPTNISSNRNSNINSNINNNNINNNNNNINKQSLNNQKDNNNQQIHQNTNKNVIKNISRNVVKNKNDIHDFNKSNYNLYESSSKNPITKQSNTSTCNNFNNLPHNNNNINNNNNNNNSNKNDQIKNKNSNSNNLKKFEVKQSEGNNKIIQENINSEFTKNIKDSPMSKVSSNMKNNNNDLNIQYNNSKQNNFSSNKNSSKKPINSVMNKSNKRNFHATYQNLKFNTFYDNINNGNILKSNCMNTNYNVQKNKISKENNMISDIIQEKVFNKNNEEFEENSQSRRAFSAVTNEIKVQDRHVNKNYPPKIDRDNMSRMDSKHLKKASLNKNMNLEDINQYNSPKNNNNINNKNFNRNNFNALLSPKDSKNQGIFKTTRNKMKMSLDYSKRINHNKDDLQSNENNNKHVINNIYQSSANICYDYNNNFNKPENYNYNNTKDAQVNNLFKNDNNKNIQQTANNCLTNNNINVNIQNLKKLFIKNKENLKENKIIKKIANKNNVSNYNTNCLNTEEYLETNVLSSNFNNYYNKNDNKLNNNLQTTVGDKNNMNKNNNNNNNNITFSKEGILVNNNNNNTYSTNYNLNFNPNNNNHNTNDKNLQLDNIQVNKNNLNNNNNFNTFKPPTSTDSCNYNLMNKNTENDKNKAVKIIKSSISIKNPVSQINNNTNNKNLNNNFSDNNLHNHNQNKLVQETAVSVNQNTSCGTKIIGVNTMNSTLSKENSGKNNENNKDKKANTRVFKNKNINICSPTIIEENSSNKNLQNST